MKWLQELDLYKVIIVVSLALLPVVGGWAYYLQQKLEEARAAVTSATKAGGDIEEIGKFQKAVEEQKRSEIMQSTSPDNFAVYFQQCIFGDSLSEEAKQQGVLQRNEFSIQEVQGDAAGRNARDRLVEIKFKPPGAGEKLLPRSLLMAILFNCEANSQIWKLRELNIRNADEALRGSGRNKPPPPTLQDVWKVDKLVFASRQPDTRRRQ